jgi:hypothetical protein
LGEVAWLIYLSPGKTGHGNDGVWKAWKAMKPASHPSHTLWKSLRDSHIPYTPGWIPEDAHMQGAYLPPVPDFASHGPFGGASWFQPHLADRDPE